MRKWRVYLEDGVSAKTWWVGPVSPMDLWGRVLHAKVTHSNAKAPEGVGHGVPEDKRGQEPSLQNNANEVRGEGQKG